ncbi:ribonuclease Z [Candidatus Thorarchaeota archaeon]|nr:MAG: ribonuclease Z [Candidatus Thorarchaeota archaeon]
MIEFVVLGSGGSIPLPGRNHPAYLIRYEGWNLLFDAGEDVQRRFVEANAGMNKHMAIFISHIHADHVLGLGGLLLRFSLLGRERPLQVFGPAPLLDFVRVNQNTINLGTTFPTTVHAIEEGIVFEQEDAGIRAFQVDHRGFTLGYEFIYQRATGPFLPEKAREIGVPEGPLWGKLASGQTIELESGVSVEPEQVTGERDKPIKIVYSGDTRPCNAVRESAKNANLLVHEAMYAEEHADLADERGHTTAREAAEIAEDADVELLLLTHYSPRYGDGQTILSEAKEVFANSMLARDLMRITFDSDGNHTINLPE